MLKTRYILEAVMLSCLMTISVQAKVTPINEYNMTITDDGKQAFNQTCSAYGWYNSIQPNAICTKQQTLMDGTQCYACHCDSKYKYACTSEGIIGSSEACSADGTRLPVSRVVRLKGVSAVRRATTAISTHLQRRIAHILHQHLRRPDLLPVTRLPVVIPQTDMNW